MSEAVFSIMLNIRYNKAFTLKIYLKWLPEIEPKTFQNIDCFYQLRAFFLCLYIHPTQQLKSQLIL